MSTRQPVNEVMGRAFNRDINDDIRIEWTAGTVSGFNPVYVGSAIKGTATSAKGWYIIKITWDANDNPTLVEKTGQTGDYTWDARATYF